MYKYMKRTLVICSYSDEHDAANLHSVKTASSSTYPSVTFTRTPVLPYAHPPVCTAWPTHPKEPKPHDPKTPPCLLRLPSKLLPTSIILP